MEICMKREKNMYKTICSPRATDEIYFIIQYTFYTLENCRNVQLLTTIRGKYAIMPDAKEVGTT